MKKKIQLSVLAVVISLGLTACGGGNQQRTIIQNKGSDTLVNVAQAWAEEYQTVDANVVVAVTGGGSGTGIAALINGTVDIANASRAMKSKEIDQAKAAGQDPVEHVVGFDALAVYLHADNPATSMSIAQLADIYGDGGPATSWTDLGIEVPGCKDQEIIVVSRQNNSGTYAYFRDTVLGKQRDFRLGTRDMHGSKDVADLVEKTPCAIGYSGLAYATDHTKLACLEAQGSACVRPSVATASDGSYPIARPLLMYTSGAPTGKVKDYMDWILSDTGQCIIKDKGYAPVRDVSCE
jgi:phosphate transport system substrate-binding protein